MKRWARLNTHQQAVLRQIGDDAAPVSSASSALATTVYALRRRGLVTTERHDGGWIARVTDAGRHYLAHGHHPDLPSSPARTRRPPEPPKPPPSPQRPPPQRPPPRRRPWTPNDPRAVDRGRLLLDRLTVERGIVRIPDPDPAARAAWRRAIHAAKAHQLIPAGKYLLYQGRDHGDLIIRLHPGVHPANRPPPSQPVEIPAVLTTPHPAVADLDAEPAALRVCPACRDRARRLLHALAAAATDRGHHVQPAGDDETASLVVVIGDHRYPVTMRETTEPQPRGRRGLWDPKPEPVYTHRLEVALPADWQASGRRSRWGDRHRWRLDAKLHQVLDAINQRALRDRAAARARRRRMLQRRADWQQAMRTARDRVIQQRRLRILDQQVTAWQRARTLRVYATTLEQQPAASDQLLRETHAWVTWIRQYADQIDPTRKPHALPPTGRIGPEDLRPHLGDWSPYGPDSHH